MKRLPCGNNSGGNFTQKAQRHDSSLIIFTTVTTWWIWSITIMLLVTVCLMWWIQSWENSVASSELLLFIDFQGRNLRTEREYHLVKLSEHMGDLGAFYPRICFEIVSHCWPKIEILRAAKWRKKNFDSKRFVGMGNDNNICWHWIACWFKQMRFSCFTVQ